MADPQIVDAIPAATSVAGVNVSQQTVPVKIDASALANMMKMTTAQQPATKEFINPAAYVMAAGERMQNMYERYEMLRKLGSALNGKSPVDPIPEDLQIEDVTITFRKRSDGDARYVAKLLNVACVGDIAQLLTTEMGVIILSLQQEAKSLAALSKSTEDTTQRAREAWENSNKDRKIVVTGEPPAAAPAGEVSLTNEN